MVQQVDQASLGASPVLQLRLQNYLLEQDTAYVGCDRGKRVPEYYYERLHLQGHKLVRFADTAGCPVF